jgi:hypothetical protein
LRGTKVLLGVLFTMNLESHVADHWPHDGGSNCCSCCALHWPYIILVTDPSFWTRPDQLA